MHWDLIFWYLLLTILPVANVFGNDAALERMVRSLSHRQELEEEKQRRQQQQSHAVIRTKFPWVIQNNTLPNYFMKKNKDGAVYTDSVVAFMHQPRAAGNSIRECMDMIATQRTLAASPVLTDEGRLNWEMGLGVGNKVLKDRVDIHRGHYSFGICDTIKKPCSYFIMMRDPWLRARSSYRYCKTALGDEWCASANANKVSLGDWIIHQGSVLFRLVIYSSDFCHNNTGGATHRTLMYTQHSPCWFVQKEKLANLTKADRDVLVNYVIENLENWFSVIGVFEEFQTSVAMFERTLGWPMSMCRSLAPRGAEENVNSRRRNSVVFSPETELASLKENPAIVAALEPDVKIYQEAKRIFARQKQVLFNKVGKGRSR